MKYRIMGCVLKNYIVLLVLYCWCVIGRVGCDRPKKGHEKNTTKTQNSIDKCEKRANLANLRFFALHEGRVGFGADPFNRTGRCTSPSSAAAATAAAAAHQKNDKSP